ncbi:MAG: DciA family protein [Fusobacteriaceae bacterium]
MLKILSIKNLIDAALKKSRKLKEIYIITNWSNIVGSLEKKSFPNYLKDKTLHVIVESSTVMHYMILNEEKYIKKCNEVINEDYIKEIRYKIGNLELAMEKICGGNNE